MAENEKIEKQKRVLPDDMEGRKITSSVACGTVHFNISFLDGCPVEVFFNGSKARGCAANQIAIGKLVSILLQNNLLDEAIDMLDGIKCPSCQHRKGELPREQRVDYPHSCADALARALKKVTGRVSLKKGEKLIEVIDKK